MEFITLLILFPVVVSLFLLIIKNNSIRSKIVVPGSLLLIGLSVFSSFKFFEQDTYYFPAHYEFVNQITLYAGAIISLVLLFLSFKYKKPLAFVLIAVQTGITLWFEISYGHSMEVANNLFIDKLSIVMILIVGIIGSLIAIYALGYMEDLHHHQTELKDNRPFFFFIIFLFLGAMNGLVLSNNLLWLFFFWEITTLCSFFLIGYKKDEISIKNSFLALVMNMLGGIFFISGIAYIGINYGTIELDKLVGLKDTVAFLPIIFLSIAGLTKSAQMPFSKWLLGAMVAPTPVSALLHSSTMVKAGVYLLIKLSPVFMLTRAGTMIALVGGITFLIASMIAVSQSDAKKVLAYSTIANLGLIVLCAGIGTTEAVWAAILLLIFHAIAKGLLFLCVGTSEHKIGSRNIESMDGLAALMPKLSWMMLIGMAGMFLAPFGMLISKWIVIKAMVEASPLLTIILVYGSSVTLFFWVKWMGKIITALNDKAPSVELDINKSEYYVLYILSIGTILLCLAFPLFSNFLIEPYLFNLYKHTISFGQGNLIIMLIMMGMIGLFVLGNIKPFESKNTRVVGAYLSGANSDRDTAFTGAMGIKQEVVLNNYYLEKYFGEEKLFWFGAAPSIAILFVAIVMFWQF